MSKSISILSILLFMLVVVSAHADWCQKPGGGLEPCGEIPSSWTNCGTLNDEPVWCWPSASKNSRPKSKNATTNTLIAVGVGVVFVGVMWYIFKTPQSSNNPGQVKLVEF